MFQVYFANCDFVANSPKFAPTSVSFHTVFLNPYYYGRQNTFKEILMIFLADVVNGRALQVFLLHEDVSLQYFIPAVMK